MTVPGVLVKRGGRGSGMSYIATAFGHQKDSNLCILQNICNQPAPFATLCCLGVKHSVYWATCCSPDGKQQGIDQCGMEKEPSTPMQCVAPMKRKENTS